MRRRIVAARHIVVIRERLEAIKSLESYIQIFIVQKGVYQHLLHGGFGRFSGQHFHSLHSRTGVHGVLQSAE